MLATLPDNTDNNSSHQQPGISSHSAAPHQQQRLGRSSSASGAEGEQTLPTTPRQHTQGSGVPASSPAAAAAHPDPSHPPSVTTPPPSQNPPSLPALPAGRTSAHTLRPLLSLPTSASRDMEASWMSPLSPTDHASGGRSRAGSSNGGFGNGVWRMASFGGGTSGEIKLLSAVLPEDVSEDVPLGQDTGTSHVSPELSLASALPAAASTPAATTSSQHQPEASPDPEGIQPAQPVHDAVLPGRRPVHVIQELLQELSGQLGVVHLALHSVDELEDETHHASQPPLDSEGSDFGSRHNAELDRNHSLGTAGLVVGWHNRVVSIVEGSKEESELLLKLGHDPSDTTLTQLFQRKSCVQAHGRDGRFSLLSRTELCTPWGAPVTSLLLQQAVPARILSSADVASMLSDWGAVIVVSANPLPTPLMDCMLRCGVKSVVSPRIDVEYAPMTAIMVAFFEAFYRFLLAGETVSDAISRAESVEPLSLGLVTHTCL
ncbi:MAG: hypothetical protein WDW38_001785 [Sanguina aurantia]